MTLKFKITHFGKYYPPEFGGIESVTAALAQDHANAGHTVTVVCFASKASKTTRDGPLQIVRCRQYAKIASQPISLSYLFHAVQHGRKADIVHIHTPNILGALAGMLIPRTVKILVHWHADISGKKGLGRLVRPLENRLLKRANSIVCTSRNYANSSPALKPFLDKVRVIPIGIPDIDRGKNIKPPESIPFNWMQKRPVILTVGRLVPYKGLFVLLEAMSRMQLNASLVIVGVGPLRAQLQKKIEHLKLADRVWLVGRQTAENLARIYANSDLFCLSSLDRAEAFGVVLLEAMRAGLPIVATDIPGSGVSWVNRHGISGENVVPNDAGQLAETIEKILKHPELKKSYSHKARLRFEKNFMQTKMTSAFLEEYSNLIRHSQIHSKQ